MVSFDRAAVTSPSVGTPVKRMVVKCGVKGGGANTAASALQRHRTNCRGLIM